MEGSPSIFCLRCPRSALKPTDSPPGLQFWACPTCGRTYTKKPGTPLTFRWGNPIALALYPVIFDATPYARSADVARRLSSQWTAAEARRAVAEITLELDSPTQPVRSIVDAVASEEACRLYLRSLVALLTNPSPVPLP
jgi:transposase-like protein